MEEPETSKKEETTAPPPRQKRVLYLNAEANIEWARANLYFEGLDVSHDHCYCSEGPNKKTFSPVPKEEGPNLSILENTLPNYSGNNETLDDPSAEQSGALPRQRLPSGEMQTMDSGVVTPQRQMTATFVSRSNSPQKIVSSGRVLLPISHPRHDLPTIQSRTGEQVRTTVFSPEGGPIRVTGAAPLILASRGTKHIVRGRTVRPQNELVVQPGTLSAGQLQRSPQRKVGEGIPPSDVAPGSMAVRLAPPLRSPDQKQISINRSPRIMRPAVHKPVASAVSTLSTGPPGEAPAPPVPQKEEVLPPHIRDVAMSLQNEPFIDPAGQYKPGGRVLREDHRPKSNIVLSPSLARQRQISSSSASSVHGSRRVVLPNSSPSRVPGSSPVRTNLDFNNHLKPAPHREPAVRSNLMSPVRSGIRSNLISPVHSNVPSQEQRKRGRKPKRREPSISNDDELIHDDEEESNEVRCICGTKEEFNELGWVMCDGCNVWQHAWCAGYNTKTEANNKYFCERCDKDKLRHRPHTAEEAADFVRGLVENERKGKKKSRAVQREISPDEPKRNQRARKRGSDVSPSRVVMSKNARQLIALSGTANHFTGPRAPPNSCAKMMVAQEEVYGLVAMAKGGIPAGTAAMELFGNVAVPNEVDRPDTFNPFLFYYDGFVDKNSNMSIQQKKENQICLDARKFAQDGRFVRRCCRPNSTIKHTFDGRQANFFIVARQNIAEREEITLPFEAGFRPKDKSLCRCSGVDGANCLLEDPNFIGPGFTDPPLRLQTPPPPPQPSPPRKGGRTRRSTATSQEVAKVKEEKSEEESAVAVSARRGRTKSASSKKESEKEEIKVEASPRTPRTPKSRAVKVEQKEPKEEEKPVTVPKSSEVPKPPIYVLPVDRNKMSREERKVKMYEKMFAKVEKEKKGGKKKGQPATDNIEPVEMKNEEEAAPKEVKKEPIETSQAPLKKRILRRWENTEEAVKEAENPAKRRKVQKAPERAEQEAADILASMDNKGVRLDVNPKGFFEQNPADCSKVEDYTLPDDVAKLLKEKDAKKSKETKLKRTSAPSPFSTRPKRERPPPKERTASTSSKTEKEPVEEIQEEAKEAAANESVRRMDLQEYKKFRNSNPNKSETPGRRQGFIPSFDASQTSASLPELPPLPETSRRTRAGAEPSIRSPPRRAAPVASTSQHPPTEERDDTHNLSIGERLKLLFQPQS